MRKPRDIDFELRELARRAKALKARKIVQLGELVIAAGAGDLETDVLVGMIKSAMEPSPTANAIGEWRRQGQAFFRGQGGGATARAARRDAAKVEEKPRPDAAGGSGAGAV
jgi:hypothetical protein